ncbi:Uu.00g051800.m01.CDS01 [Anthostomella pinea]|uniref:Uu.00g051800.m01.CDS01 n=1 Tax=Anthostomella pinea TaxID=933095 RepID=A0AAI8VX21_9PEZI|nr:Uu.00g051800.m01.CDS01 [Anthostomella pinea]
MRSGHVSMNVTLPAGSFNLGEYPGQLGICQAVFNSPGNMDAGSLWIIGSPLLKAYYTVWDGLNHKIGWATLKSPSGGDGQCTCKPATA